MNGRSQAVRLPKEFRLPGRLAKIRSFGDGILLEPINKLGVSVHFIAFSH